MVKRTFALKISSSSSAVQAVHAGAFFQGKLYLFSADLLAH